MMQLVQGQTKALENHDLVICLQAKPERLRQTNTTLKLVKNYILILQWRYRFGLDDFKLDGDDIVGDYIFSMIHCG